ncbi:MAG: purine-nucleoside phosphorylase [Filifactor alocis]|nr:purine-nucleoside phosphorylase [Filifactor alocis]
MHKYDQVMEAAKYIKSKVDVQAKTAIVLGSGLSGFAEKVEKIAELAYRDIPHFCTSKVEGHKNRLVVGEVQGRQVLVLQGRYHYYEGYSVEEISFPIRVLQFLGIEKLILTNASGAVDRSFVPGDIMLITDHINTVGRNPLIGANDQRMGERFPDMSRVYSERLRSLALKAAVSCEITLREGVYVWTSGPMFETPAEIRAYEIMGGSAVGMSTVPEAIVAAHAKMEVLGLSCISNMAAGISQGALSLEEVFDTMKENEDRFTRLMFEILRDEEMK